MAINSPNNLIYISDNLIENSEDRIDTGGDLLSQILSQYKLRAEVFSNPTVCGNWRINTQGLHRAGFHLVCEGGCWLHTAGQDKPRWLNAGDLVFLPRDIWHVLSAEQRIEDDTMQMTDDGEGPRTILTCGSVAFEDPAGEALLATLPCPLLIASNTTNRPDTQQLLARMLVSEAAGYYSGRQALLNHLAEIVFIVVLRHVIGAGLAGTGLLAGLRDRNLRRSLQAIHSDWMRNWRLEELAELSNLARSTFARRFKQVIGQTPIDYVDQWRMWHAERLLHDRTHSVAQVAEQLHYASEAAFRRAFTRLRGKTPGQARKNQ